MPETRPEPHDPSDPQSEDAAWREIVANFGERVDLPPDEDLPTQSQGQSPEHSVVFGDDVDEAFESEPVEDWAEEGFIPALPDPVRLPLDRRIAWAAVLGVPAAAMVAAFFVQTSSATLPSWAGLLMALVFLGGFGYLVATMPKEREDPWDDGARL